MFQSFRLFKNSCWTIILLMKNQFSLKFRRIQSTELVFLSSFWSKMQLKASMQSWPGTEAAAYVLMLYFIFKCVIRLLGSISFWKSQETAVIQQASLQSLCNIRQCKTNRSITLNPFYIDKALCFGVNSLITTWMLHFIKWTSSSSLELLYQKHLKTLHPKWTYYI